MENMKNNMTATSFDNVYVDSSSTSFSVHGLLIFDFSIT